MSAINENLGSLMIGVAECSYYDLPVSRDTDAELLARLADEPPPDPERWHACADEAPSARVRAARPMDPNAATTRPPPASMGQAACPTRCLPAHCLLAVLSGQ